MSKNKYTPDSGSGKQATEKKGRENYNKSGKQARRREQRRLEAIGRQVVRIQSLLEIHEKQQTKKSADDLQHARLTLLKIRGGVPHKELIAKFNTAEPTPTPTAPAVEEIKPNKKERKAAKKEKKVRGAAKAKSGAGTPQPAQGVA